jgi:hypothetical protein
VKQLRLLTPYLAATSIALIGCAGEDEPNDPLISGAGGYGAGGFPVAGMGGYTPVPGGGGYTPVPGGGGYTPGMGGSAFGTGGSALGGGGTDPGAGGSGLATGGTDPGAGGAPPGGAGGAPPGDPPPCITDAASQGIILGDSYVTGFGSPPLQPALAKLIPAIGQFKNYAGAGCSMVNGGACTGAYGNVIAQSTTALREKPNAKLVIMDGGGNDILICDVGKFPNCNTLCAKAGSSQQKVCTDIVAAAVASADTLMTQAAAAGVKDVVYFFYPHIPAAGGGYKEILDYALPLARQSCESAATKTSGKLHCHFVDMVQPFIAAFGDAAPAQFEGFQIHPLQPGVDLMAKEITDTMKENCLGQASGCCAAQ